MWVAENNSSDDAYASLFSILFVFFVFTKIFLNKTHTIFFRVRITPLKITVLGKNFRIEINGFEKKIRDRSISWVGGGFL